MKDNENLKEIRIEARRYLYERPGGAMDRKAILRGVKREGIDCDEPTLLAQLAILTERGQVKQVADPDMPAVKAWQITGEGIAYHEEHHA